MVLAGYKTVKEALVGRAEEFGDRAVFPMIQDISKGHGRSVSLSCMFLYVHEEHFQFRTTEFQNFSS